MNASRLCMAATLLCVSASALTEDIEPRRWTPLPVDLTVVGVGTIRGEGDIGFDPVLEIEDATVETTTTFLSILRTFDLFGKSARVDVRLPHQRSRWKGLLAGEPRTVDRRGPGDPRIRLSVNFLGSPALRGKAFRAFRASRTVNTVAGAGLAVILPLGEYQKDKLLNLGQNRFTIRPQLGVVHTRGPWSAELTGSVSVYTDNHDFLVSHKREQDALFALQAHAIYTPPSGWWVSLSTAYDWGGESTVDGIAKDDHREDILYGLATGLALGPQVSLQLAYVANRTQTELGADTDYLALGCSIRF